MTNEKLEILVIEDNEKHLADAMIEINRRIKAGQNINTDVVRDLVGYFSIKGTKKYNGIISDIFFPTSIINPNDNLANNLVWDVLGRNYCEEHKEDYLGRDEWGRKMFRMVQDDWMDGKEIPPTGVVIADYAKKEGIPIVFCTDTYHHGTSTQPVFEYAQKNRIPMIDSWGSREGSSAHKDWEKAFDKLIVRIIGGGEK